jgi:Cu(I)/Ag(I) efflux system membrane fusion protein
MEVYSPELVAAQEEYLIALRGIEESGAARPVMQRMAEAALRRLKNWGIAERELETLRLEGKPRQFLTLRSPAAGVVLQKSSVQGMRFMPGETLYEIADLSSVWMLVDVFEQDVRHVGPGQEAQLRIASYPEQLFAGKVVFVYPTLDPATRTARVRIELPNPQGLLKPAMYGAAEFTAGHPNGKVLAVPDSAVLDSGKRQSVLVRRGEGLFEPRAVKLGMRADGYSEVIEGLQSGEEVVVRANFLIDAESNLKAALDSFGKNPSSQAHKARGTVQAVDPNDGSIEISHEPIPSLNWPAMSMEFKVKDKALLAGLKPGQAVDFDLAQANPGEFVIERMVPAGAPPAGAAHKGH